MRAALAVLAVALAPQVASAQLQDLIQRNVRSSTRLADQLNADQRQVTSQLWIHVRNDAQKRLVDANRVAFANLHAGGRPVAMRPVQVVSSGPPATQLRYFRTQDRARAVELEADLERMIGPVQLQDLSPRYEQAGYVEVGHFELWLGAGVDRLSTPR